MSHATKPWHFKTLITTKALFHLKPGISIRLRASEFSRWLREGTAALSLPGSWREATPGWWRGWFRPSSSSPPSAPPPSHMSFPSAPGVASSHNQVPSVWLPLLRAKETTSQMVPAEMPLSKSFAKNRVPKLTSGEEAGMTLLSWLLQAEFQSSRASYPQHQSHKIRVPLRGLQRERLLCKQAMTCITG